MNPYSHIVVASKLETLVNPVDVQEYYWGTIVPDIRYLAAIPRQQTHIPLEKIIGFISQYPHLKSFLQGYLLHCLSDEIELGQVFFKHFPFSILKSKLSRHRMSIILDLYYFENERVNKNLSGTHNEILSELGLSEMQSAKFSQSISQYVMASSFDERVTYLVRLLDAENNSQIDKYMAAIKKINQNWLIKNSFFRGIGRGKISEQIVSLTAELYQQCDV